MMLLLMDRKPPVKPTATEKYVAALLTGKKYSVISALAFTVKREAK